MKNSGEDKDNDDGFNILRAKTREVEVLGQKIDEALTIFQDTEALILKLGRYNDQVY